MSEYLKSADDNGIIILMCYSRHNSENSVEEKGWKAEEEQKIIKKWDRIHVHIQLCDLTIGTKHSDNHKDQKTHLRGEVNPLGSKATAWVIQSNIENDDADNSPHENQKSGKESLISWVAISVDHQMVCKAGRRRVVMRMVVTTWATVMTNAFPLPNILPHYEQYSN